MPEAALRWTRGLGPPLTPAEAGTAKPSHPKAPWCPASIPASTVTLVVLRARPRPPRLLPPNSPTNRRAVGK